MPVLTELFIYPLKSGARQPRSRAVVERLGIAHDRRWMVVRPDGEFVTGREMPSMLRVQAVPVEGGLHLSAPGQPDLIVPPPPEHAPRLQVTIWRDRCSAACAGEEADGWLSRYLGEPSRLVHVDAKTERAVDPQYAKPGEQVSFADGFPLLLLSRASLDELNRRLARPVTMGNFRPNLVIDGCDAFAEDGWKRLRIGEVELAVVKPCARCALPNVDPEAGVASPDGEPLRTLASFRRTENKVLFGQNAIARRLGTLQVGDAVEVLE